MTRFFCDGHDDLISRVARIEANTEQTLNAVRDLAAHERSNADAIERIRTTAATLVKGVALTSAMIAIVCAVVRFFS